MVRQPVIPDIRRGLVLDLAYQGAVSDGGIWHDRSGCGNHGILHGNAYVNNAGANFDGSGDHVAMTTIRTPRPTTVSLSFFVRFNSLGSTRCLIDCQSAEPWFGYGGFLNSAGKFVFEVYTASSGAVSLQTNSTLSTGTLYHIAATYDGGTMRLYVNGALDATGAGGSGAILYAVQTDLTLGARSIDTSYYNFDGTMDDIRIYNRSLDASEIIALYNRGKWRRN